MVNYPPYYPQDSLTHFCVDSITKIDSNYIQFSDHELTEKEVLILINIAKEYIDKKKIKKVNSSKVLHNNFAP